MVISKAVENDADAPPDLWPPQTREPCHNLVIDFTFLNYWMYYFFVAKNILIHFLQYILEP